MKNKLTLLLPLLFFIGTTIFAQPVNLTPTNGANVIMVGGSVSLQWVAGGAPPFTLTYTINGAPQAPIVIPASPTISPFPIFPAAGGLVVGDLVNWTITDASGISLATAFTVISAPTPTPLDAATGVSQATASVDWTAFDEGGYGNGNYDVDFDNDPAFGSIDASLANTALTSLALPALAYNTTYYWRVRDTDIDGVGTNGTWFNFSFTTEIATPALTAPANAATGQSITPTLTWTLAGGTGGVTYDLEYHTGGGFPGTFVLGITSPYSSTTFPYNTTVTWRIIAKKAGEANKTSGSRTFTTLLATPVQTSPANASSALYSTPRTFTWTQANAKTNVKYTIDVSTASGGGFDAAIIHTNTTAVNPALTQNFAIAYAGVYYWRVKAIVDDGGAPNNTETTTSSIFSFTMTLPGPSLTVPINGITGVSVLPTCTWGSVTGAVSYKLYIDDADDGWGTPLYAINQGTNLTKTFAATIANFPLTNGTLYYWKVAAIDNNGNEFASSTYHFTTTPDPSITLSQPSGTIYSSPATFSWYSSGSTSGLKFIVQYMISAAPTTESDWSGATTLASTTSLTTTGTVLYGKTYYWRVLVQRTSNSEYVYYPAPTTYGTFTTAGGGSVTVTPSWPTGGATVYTNAPTLYWYLDQYASGLTYYINYSTSSATGGSPTALTGGGGVLNQATGSSNLYYTLPTLTPGTIYYWQVRAYYADGSAYSAWTTPESFVTNGSGTLQVPIPSYPTGGVTVYTTSPTVYWYFNTAVTGLTYQVDWVDSTAGGGHSQSANTLIPTSYQITGLTPGNTIGWRVRSYNGTSYSLYSSTVTFVVAGGTAASYAVASYPIGNPTVYTNTPTLYWYLEGSSLGISSYVVKYKKNAAPANWTNALGGPNADEGQYTGLSNSLFSKQITTDLTYGATYYWAVYATGTAHPINALGVGSFTVVGGSTATTIALSTPSDASTVYSTGTTLYWYVNGSSTGIVDYTVQVSQSDVFASYFFNDAVTTTYKALTGLTNGATYYWKVKANYADASSTSYSSTWSFTVNTGSPSIVQPLVGGPNNVTVNTASPTLSWVLPAPTAANSTYEVQLAENPNFQSAKTFGSSKSNMVVSGLVGGKSYFWKVRSKDGTGNTSYYSGTGQFRVNSSVTAVEDKEVIPTQFELSQNYPNPFNPSTRIAYALPQNSYVSIKVYDMLGREIKALVNSEMSAGNHSVDWNGDDNNGTKAASGTYIYRITVGNFVAVKKMILIK